MKQIIALFCIVAIAATLSAQGSEPQAGKKATAKQQFPTNSSTNKVQYSVIGSIDIMYGYFKRNHYGFAEITLINGIRIKRSRMGIGVSLMGDFRNKPDDFTSAPYYHTSWQLMQSGGISPVSLFLNYQQEFCRGKIKPTLGVTAGYPLFYYKNVVGMGWNTSIPSYNEQYWQKRGLFYGAVEAGFTYRVRKRVYFNHSLVYKLLAFNLVNSSSEKNTATGEYIYKGRVYEKATIAIQMIGLSTKIIF
ncbi:MAG: hypothetical protein V4615_15045 [Bacteroidota bacterium]